MTVEMDYGWHHPEQDMQCTLFPEERDAALARLRVSLDDVNRWRELGWISFDVALKETLDSPEVQEIVFIRNMARSGLPYANITALLGGLQRPYRYDIVRVAYSFTLGWVQIPAMPSDCEVNDFMRENLEKWIVDRLAEEDTDSLTKAVQRIQVELTQHRASQRAQRLARLAAEDEKE